MLSECGPEEGPFRVIWELINNAGGYFTGVQSIVYLKPRAVFICGWMKTAPPTTTIAEGAGKFNRSDLGKTLFLVSECDEIV